MNPLEMAMYGMPKYVPRLSTVSNPYPDEDDGLICPCCLSDHLSEEDIKPDGLCEACTECTECEKCEKWKLPQDMATEEICCDCVEWIEVLKKSDNIFQETHGYGKM